MTRQLALHGWSKHLKLCVPRFCDRSFVHVAPGTGFGKGSGGLRCVSAEGVPLECVRGLVMALEPHSSFRVVVPQGLAVRTSEEVQIAVEAMGGVGTSYNARFFKASILCSKF